MWRIIFSAIFLVLCHNTLSFKHTWHKDWISDSHDHDCLDSYQANSPEFFPSFEDSDISYSGPDSDNIDSPEFPLDHPDNWEYGHHDDDSPSDEDSSSEEWPSKNNDKDGGPDSHEKYHPYHHKRFNKIPPTTTTQEPTTKELKTDSTTKFTTKPIITTRHTTETITTPTTTIRSTREITTKPTITTRSTREATTKPTITTRSTTETATKPTTTTRSTREATTKPTITTRSTTKPITTTESTKETTTETNQDFANCIRLCTVTSEYNPVCGTDLVTYANPGRLICAQRCGLDVKILKRTVCPRNITHPSSTSQSPLLITTAKIDSKTPSETQVQQDCIKWCEIITPAELQPVCGTNDITYKNADHLLCVQLCGVDVRLKYISSCVQKSVSTTSIPGDVTTPLPVVVRLCIESCPIMEEDKPICATNDVTYKNPSHLQCAQTCGVNVKLKHKLPCQNKTEKVVTTTPSQLSLQKSSQEICIDTCFKDSEYKPVCGSNNVTYRNIDHLQCARACFVDVKLHTLFACEVSSVVPEITSSENSGNMLTTSTTRAPLFTNVPQDQNGSNNVSDKNPTTTAADEIDFRSGKSS